MAERPLDPVLLVVPDEELSGSDRIWGTGGWRPPTEREALDWLTLARFLGWGVRIDRASALRSTPALPAGIRWLIVAGDPDALGESCLSLLASRLASEPILVVARAGRDDGPFARLSGAARGLSDCQGGTLRQIGAPVDRTWHCREPLLCSPLSLASDAGAYVWATLDEAPYVTCRRVGRGMVASLGFHPSHARDAGGAVTAMLKELLLCGLPAPAACFDLQQVMVLRMDDAGGAQNIHSRRWSYTKLDEPAWAAIGTHLRRHDARLSIGYVPSWVDDGDPARGELSVGGRAVSRVPGAVYDSPLVAYRRLQGDRTREAGNNYAGEFRGIQRLRAAGLADVELHGCTHMHPNRRAWASAPDRYETTSWFRELGERRGAADSPNHPLEDGVAALRRQFGTTPTTLIPPGDEWNNDDLERALELGLHCVDSYYLALRDDDRFCWTTHVAAPYLDQPDGKWFASGLPVVGYFHDRDVAVEGPAWLGRCLDWWSESGARRFIDFRELTAALARRVVVDQSHPTLRLVVTARERIPLVRPLPILVWTGGRPLPDVITLDDGGDERLLAVQVLDAGLGRVLL